MAIARPFAVAAVLHAVTPRTSVPIVGVNARASRRGANHVGLPSSPHCIGSLDASCNVRFARTDSPTSSAAPMAPTIHDPMIIHPFPHGFMPDRCSILQRKLAAEVPAHIEGREILPTGRLGRVPARPRWPTSGWLPHADQARRPVAACGRMVPGCIGAPADIARIQVRQSAAGRLGEPGFRGVFPRLSVATLVAPVVARKTGACGREHAAPGHAAPSGLGPRRSDGAGRRAAGRRHPGRPEPAGDPEDRLVAPPAGLALHPGRSGCRRRNKEQAGWPFTSRDERTSCSTSWSH